MKLKFNREQVCLMSQSWANMHDRPRLLKFSGMWPAEQASRLKCVALRNASVFSVSTESVMLLFSVFQVMPVFSVIPLMLVFTVFPVMLIFSVFPVIPVMQWCQFFHWWESFKLTNSQCMVVGNAEHLWHHCRTILVTLQSLATLVSCNHWDHWQHPASRATLDDNFNTALTAITGNTGDTLSTNLTAITGNNSITVSLTTP